MAANYTIHAMRLAKKKQQPFAIFTGFRRPHTPWTFPARFWDLYKDQQLPAAAHPLPPKNFVEVRSYNIYAFIFIWIPPAAVNSESNFCCSPASNSLCARTAGGLHQDSVRRQHDRGHQVQVQPDVRHRARGRGAAAEG